MIRLLLLLLTAAAATAPTAAEPAAAAPAAAPVHNPAVDGPKIIAETFGRLSSALAVAIEKAGPAGAVPVCSEKAPVIAAEVGKTHGVTVRRASAKPRQPKNTADAAEKAALASFAAALGQQQTPTPQIVTEPDGSRTFFAPIVLTLPLCLQCHGIPGRDIAPATLDAITKNYPEDKATGFQLGDLRGLWRVTFPVPR